MNFWVRWCLEGRLELPRLERIHQEFVPQGLAVGVNARENAERIRRNAKELGLTFPLVLGPDGKINAAYGGRSSHDLRRRPRWARRRPGRWASRVAGTPARALIQALLAEPAPHAR